jgi:GAF domain-containing protein/HAMP domain-containing protein
MVLGQAAVEQVAIKDELKYVAYQPLNNINWRLGTVVPVPLATAASAQLVKVVESGSGQALRGMLLWTTGLLLVALIGGAMLVRRFLTPLRHMVTATETIAAGDLDSRVAVTSHDEIGFLAVAFNKMTDQLRELIGSLEDQVQDRTVELSLSMEVGQQAVAIRSLDILLPTITEFIRDKFNLYYTHVYFVDDIGESLIIQAGTGEVGRELLAQHHNLPIGPGSIVGQVAATGEPVLVSDTETSDIHKPNPLLPDTRSELAVPLIVEGQVIGVLDMQSQRVNTFRQENLTVFEAMATQLAISIDSARQWSVAQEARRKSEEAVRQLTRESWAEKLAREKRNLGYVYDLSAVKPISKSNDETAMGGVSAPLVVQNQPIGRLAVGMPSDRTWTSEEQDLLAAVAQQLAQKAESLRLFEQTQERATREQIARQITDKIRTSRDIEAALKTAVEELSKALDTSRAVVDLKVTQTEQNGHGDS